MSREQIVRDTAYAIWEAEGRPEGRHGEHWSAAEARVAASLSEKAPAGTAKAPADKDTASKDKAPEAVPPAKGPAKVSSKPSAKEPAKAAATKAAKSKV